VCASTRAPSGGNIFIRARATGREKRRRGRERALLFSHRVTSPIFFSPALHPSFPPAARGPRFFNPLRSGRTQTYGGPFFGLTHARTQRMGAGSFTGPRSPFFLAPPPELPPVSCTAQKRTKRALTKSARERAHVATWKRVVGPACVDPPLSGSSASFVLGQSCSLRRPLTGRREADQRPLGSPATATLRLSAFASWP
jgi:hypothetical protein